MGAEGKFEIVAIPNKYKDTFDDLIDSLDTEFPDQSNSPDRPELIDKGSHNMPRSRNDSLTFSEEDCLNKDVLVTLLDLTPKIQTSQVHQRHDVIPLGPKSGKA